MTRERDRYGRASLAEQLGNLVGWFRAHPVALTLVAIVVLGIIVQLVAPRRSALPNDLAVGDCLFVPTAESDAVGPGARPIGAPDEVARVLMRGGAEPADCRASHGHEVSAIFDYPRQEETRGPPIAVRCIRAFGTYVGSTVTVTSFVTFAATPTVEQWDAGIHRLICLVARRDGQWMDHPARGSGE